MTFEWDEEKRQATLNKRGLDFADAERIFSGPILTKHDTRKDYGEDRYITLGALLGRPVLIVHTPRGDAVRIISMRKANEEEKAVYWEQAGAAGQYER